MASHFDLPKTLQSRHRYPHVTDKETAWKGYFPHVTCVQVEKLGLECRSQTWSLCSSHSATFNALHVSKINVSAFLYTVSFFDFLISALIHPGPLDQPLMFPLNSCIPSVPEVTPTLSSLVPPRRSSHHFVPAIVA